MTPCSHFTRWHATRILCLLLPTVLLLASGARAADLDDFQVVLQHVDLPTPLHLPPGQPLTQDKAQALWQGLLLSPASLRSFAPRTTLARLLREALASGQSLSSAELRSRSTRFRRLVVARPDGYVATALTGMPLAHLGRPTLYQGELYTQRLRIGAFHFDEGGVFYAVDDSLQRYGTPVGELPLGRDPATAALLGAEDALAEMVLGLAALFTEPVRTLEGLAQLPSAVAALIASSPDYFARYGAMNLDDQVREAARLATHVLTLYGGAATTGPRLAAAARVPVLGVSVQGALVVQELAVSAGAIRVVVGAGAVSASVVLMAQAGPPASWPPPPEGPGQWTQEKEHMSPEAQRYQSQLTGTPAGWVYRIRTGPSTSRKEGVDFDGFKDGVLLEAKGPGYRKLLEKMYGKPWFRCIDKMLDQAQRQLSAAKGSPVQWHFAEREVADLVRQAFEDNNLGRIKVFHTPDAP
jgi:hypothetical protein